MGRAQSTTATPWNRQARLAWHGRGRARHQAASPRARPCPKTKRTKEHGAKMEKQGTSRQPNRTLLGASRPTIKPARPPPQNGAARLSLGRARSRAQPEPHENSRRHSAGRKGAGEASGGASGPDGRFLLLQTHAPLWPVCSERPARPRRAPLACESASWSSPAARGCSCRPCR